MKFYKPEEEAIKILPFSPFHARFHFFGNQKITCNNYSGFSPFEARTGNCYLCYKWIELYQKYKNTKLKSKFTCFRPTDKYNYNIINYRDDEPLVFQCNKFIHKIIDKHKKSERDSLDFNPSSFNMQDFLLKKTFFLLNGKQQFYFKEGEFVLTTKSIQTIDSSIRKKWCDICKSQRESMEDVLITPFLKSQEEMVEIAQNYLDQISFVKNSRSIYADFQPSW